MATGFKAIVYDDNGALFFLILHNKANDAWEFFKGKLGLGIPVEQAVHKEILEKLGLRRFKITKQFSTEPQGEYENTFFLVETSMNTPVRLGPSVTAACNTYLWAKEDRVVVQLNPVDKQVFERAVAELRSQQKQDSGFQFV